jgi:16S rRNA (cytosine967-C5)-methyltransferase
LAPKSPGPSTSRPQGGPRRPAAGKLVPGLAARHVAAEAVRRAIRERRALDEALSLSSNGPRQLNDADFGLARAIATVTFRRMGTLRAVMGERLKDGKIPDAGLLAEAMLTGAAQILFMDVPDHAAVDLAVEMAKSDRLAMHYAPLANAVLRGIARDKADILASLEGSTVDTPDWMLERWSAAYGEDNAYAIARVHATPPHVDLTAMGDAAALAKAVGGILLPTGSVRLTSDTAVPSLPGFAEGAFQVQDAASALPARLVGATAGMRILDLCAAPGGKTAQLAATGAHVTAVERSAQRAERLTENLARLRLSADLVIGDAGEYQAEAFDAVLLDAPCSATGTIRRHPEIAWTKTLQDILALGRQQQRLLAHAASLVKPGGILVYSTCSLEREEGERQIARWLATEPGFAILPVNPGELGVEPASVTAEGFLRALPAQLSAHGGMDGFFAARLRRAL